MIEGVREGFAPAEISVRWAQLAIGRARVERGERLRLVLEEARAGHLALALVDDGLPRPRERYLWRPPLVLEARVRFSHPAGELLGTAGFGLWNNPAPLWSACPQASPQWLWFCYASPPAAGLRAAVTGGSEPGPLAWLWPGRKGQPALEAPLAGELMAGWHDYRIAWLPHRVLCQVDGRRALETVHSPPGPLSLVAWVGNDWMGRTAPLGHLAIERPQWLEVEYLAVATGNA